jgi:hypothetical protein
MSRLNRILLSLTIFLLLAIVGVAVLLVQSAKQEAIEQKIEVAKISESSFVHKDWPLTVDPDFVPGGFAVSSSSEVEVIESDISSISSAYSQRSSVTSNVSAITSTQTSTSSKKAVINSTVVETSSGQEVVISKI